MVWLGMHRGQKAPVAIKVMNADVARIRSSHVAFRSEVRAMAQLEHPSIISVLDYGAIPPNVSKRSRGLLPTRSPYLVMEYVPPQNLGMFSSVSSYAQLRDILAALLSALGHAHARGVIHRDLKPENILFAVDDQGQMQLKLTDFGLAHSLHEPGSEKRRGITEKTTAGTPRYMAPEQIMGRFREFGPWTDLYALGCLVYHLCAGAPPFDFPDRNAIFRAHALETPPPLQVPFALPDGFDAWLQRLLAKAPLERFNTAAHALSELLALDGSPPPRIREVHERLELEGTGLGLFGLRPTPLKGREAVWAHLEGALQRVLEGGTPQMIVLQGGAGLGKTRLIQSLAVQAHERGQATHIRANHTPYGQPGRSLLRAVGEHLRCLGLTFDELGQYLSGFLEARGRKDPAFAQQLQRVLSPLAVDIDEQAELTPRLDAAARHAALLELLALLTQRSPLILSLDNAQWGPASLAFAERVLASGLPVLVTASVLTDTGAATPELMAQLDALAAERLTLEPLPEPAIGDIVRSMLPLERSLVEHVVSRSEGNPLFAVQLVADFVERGALMLGRYGFRLKPGAHVLLPASIHQAWTRRLNRIAQQVSPGRPEATLLALELVAAFGGTVVTAELAAACRLQGFSLPESLAEQLAGEGLASAAESGWSLRPAALQDTLVRIAHDAGRWSYHHMTCASALQGLYRPRVDVLERVGRHFALANATDRAFDILKRAFAQRLSRGNTRRADAVLEILDGLLSRTGEPPGSPAWRELRLLRATRAAATGEMGWSDWQKVSRHGLQQLEPLDAARALEDVAALARSVGQEGPASSALGEAARIWEQLGNAERAAALRSDA